MMKKHLILMVTAAAALTVSEALSGAQEFNRLPYFCKWVSSDEAVFSYDGSYTDDEAFPHSPRTRRCWHSTGAMTCMSST